MKLLRAGVVLSSLLVFVVPAHADDDWKGFGNVLDLAQVFVGIAAHSPRPQRDMDDVLAGRNPRANRAASGLFDDATEDMPPQYRDRLAALGRDFVALARKSAREPHDSAQEALQARKDLTAMGLRYYDPKDFIAAVKRNDELAVGLFIAGRGVNLAARDAAGRSALDIARANGNTALAAELARNLPPAR